MVAMLDNGVVIFHIQMCVVSIVKDQTIAQDCEHVIVREMLAEETRNVANKLLGVNRIETFLEVELHEIPFFHGEILQIILKGQRSIKCVVGQELSQMFLDYCMT